MSFHSNHAQGQGQDQGHSSQSRDHLHTVHVSVHTHAYAHEVTERVLSSTFKLTFYLCQREIS